MKLKKRMHRSVRFFADTVLPTTALSIISGTLSGGTGAAVLSVSRQGYDPIFALQLGAAAGSATGFMCIVTHIVIENLIFSEAYVESIGNPDSHLQDNTPHRVAFRKVNVHILSSILSSFLPAFFGLPIANWFPERTMEDDKILGTFAMGGLILLFPQIICFCFGYGPVVYEAYKSSLGKSLPAAPITLANNEVEIGSNGVSKITIEEEVLDPDEGLRLTT